MSDVLINYKQKIQNELYIKELKKQQLKIKYLKNQKLKNQINKSIFNIKRIILFNFKNIENFNKNINNNTVLFIEPRYCELEIILILANTYNKLNNNWNYVFYCGNSYYNKWKSILPNFIEIRQLEHDNFENFTYSDFCKNRELWNSLYGDYVLTIQLDTWILNKEPYNINYFINLNKSYIGGNMEYNWKFFERNNININIRNFNGGLSLRKRESMIKIIDEFPPLPTIGVDEHDGIQFETEAEDVYFTIGCMKLNLPIGDDEPSSHFALHTIYHDDFFGIHNPFETLQTKLKETNPYLIYLNKYLIK